MQWIGKFKLEPEQSYEPCELEGPTPQIAAENFAHWFCDEHGLKPETFQVFVKVEDVEYRVHGGIYECDDGYEEVCFNVENVEEDYYGTWS